MADENVTTVDTENDTEPQGAESQPEQSTDPNSDGINWKSESRKWEDRAKRALKQLENGVAPEEMDRITSELEAANAELSALKTEKARTETVRAAATESGVDAELLGAMAGDTPEQIAANAVLLKTKLAAMPIYPSATDNGAGAAPTTSKDQIEKISDPVERVKQRAAHPELYK